LNNEEANPLNTAEMNRLIAQMPNVRVFYHKKGRVKYISHLDMTRCMQRSLKRAGIPVWYTQGFNPHMYMTFALPLALGYESECEVMDLRLTERVDFGEMKRALNEALPRDIRVSRIALQKNKPQTIAKAKYEVTFACAEPERFAEAFDAFCAQEQIMVVKKTKKGEKEIDIKPEIEVLEKRLEDGVAVYTMMTSAGQKNINPTLLTDLFFETSGMAGVSVGILRKRIYMEDGKKFE